MSSTLDLSNYEQHRPHSSIIQNLEIVPEGSVTRKALVLIGSSDKQVLPEYQNKGLILIDSSVAARDKLVGENNTPTEGNILYKAAVVALAAGGNYAFYVLPAEEKGAFTRVKIETYVYGALIHTKYGNVSKSSYSSSSASLTYTLDGELKDTSITVNNGNIKDVVENNTSNANEKSFLGSFSDHSKEKEDGTVVRYEVIRVTAATWDTAPKILANSDKSLVVVPLTYNLDHQRALAQVVADLSTEDNQKWKRMYRPEWADPTITSDSSIISSADTIASKIKANNLAVTGGNLKIQQRCATVWTAGATQAVYDEVLRNTSVTTMSNILVAAGIGALRASLLPQQGLSMRKLEWIYSIPNSYLKFDKEGLNKIAVAGTFIIMQEDEDSLPFVRHQLTTDLTQGILYYEDSVGVNVDMICYGIKDIVNPYLGQRNNTNETLIEIRNQVTDYLIGLTNVGTDSGLRKIGPQIKQVDLQSIIVKLDSTYKDRVIISFDIEIPLPINTIKVHVNAYADLSHATVGEA